MDEQSDAPLAGVRVLEVGGGVPAAFATHLLAGYGAEVVRAELTATGGDSAADAAGGGAGAWGPPGDDEAVYLLAGKSRVTVDDGQLRGLARAADLVVEDQLPGVLAARGLDPAELRAERPELIVVSITPFGQTGPYAGYRVSNAVSFAMGGIMSLTGDLDRPPLVTGGDQALYLAGLNGFGAGVSAYLGCLLQGDGDWLDISAQEVAASMIELYVPGTAYGGPVQLRLGNQVRAVWGIYPCLDGYAGAFCLERQIRGLYQALEDPELDDERFTNPIRRLDADVNDELLAKMYGFFAERSKADVLAMGPRYKVPFGVVMTPADLLAAPGLSERDFWDRIDVSLDEAGVSVETGVGVSVGTGGGQSVTVPGRPFPGLGWVGPRRLHAPGEDTTSVLDTWCPGSAR